MEQNNLKKSAIANTIWKLMERFLAQGISFVVAIVIARILDPDDYSVVSIVTIFFTFANLLISSGLNTALIQKKDADSEDYATVFSISLVISIVIYIALFFLAYPISRLYGKPVLVPIFHIMGLILPVDALKSIVCAKVSSDLLFKKFFFATLGGTLFSGIVGIVMAKMGFGAWALVAQQMINTIIDTVILYILVPLRLKFFFARKKFSRLFGYGWKIFVSSFIGTVYTELNPLLIGLKFSSGDLAFYTKGRSFPGLVSSVSTNTLAAVLFPVLSRKQDDKELLLKYTRLYIRVASFMAFPLMIGLAVISDSFVAVLLTEKWLPAVPYIKIFCFAFMFDMIHIGNCETIKAMGRSDIYLLIEIIKKVGYFVTIGIFVFIARSPLQLAMAYIVCTLIALIVNSIPNQVLLDYKLSNQLADIIPNLFISLLMGVGVYFVGKLQINSIVLLFIQIVVGIIVYILINVITKNQSFRYVCSSAKEFLKK